MWMSIMCVVSGLVAVGCAVTWLISSLELRALRSRLSTVVDAQQEADRLRRTAHAALAHAEFTAARIVNEARGKLLAAEDEAAQLLASARARSEDHDVDAITGVYRTVRPHAVA